VTKTTPKPSKPRYRVLAETLMQDIRDGKLEVGTRLPGELDLVEEHKVSRHTVRESLRVLEDLGLIERHQGLGTLVRARSSQPSYVHQVQSPTDLMQYPKDSRLTFVGLEEIKTSRALARFLKCRSGTRWVGIDAIRDVQDSKLALCWVNIYVLPEYAGLASKMGRSNKPVYELIEKHYDEQIASVEVDFRPTQISPEVGLKLGVDAGSPSMTLVRRYVGRGKRPFVIPESEHPAAPFNHALKLDRARTQAHCSTPATFMHSPPATPV